MIQNMWQTLHLIDGPRFGSCSLRPVWGQGGRSDGRWTAGAVAVRSAGARP
jgi:hypothetical protein